MESNELLLTVIGFYLLACILIASEAKKRGWEWLKVFLIGLVTSPLIAAILFSPYKAPEPPAE